MTPNKPPTDMPDDPALSRLFQENLKGEPPTALDAAILAAAHDAVVPKLRPKPWWLRFQAPFAVAATLVLAVMLTLTMEHNPPETSTTPTASPPAQKEEKRSDAAPASAAKRAPTETPQPEKLMERAAKLAKPEPLPPPKPAAPAPAAAFPKSPADSGESILTEGRTAAKAASPSLLQDANRAASGAAGKLSAPATQPASAPTNDAAPLEKAKSSRALEAAPAPAAAGVAPQRLRQEAHNLSADEWIALIRQLRQQGQETEATRQLQAFRKTYPDFNLPEDLR